MTRITEMNTDW